MTTSAQRDASDAALARWAAELKDLEKRSKLPAEEQARRNIFASPLVRGINAALGKEWDEDKGVYIDWYAIRKAEDEIRKAEDEVRKAMEELQAKKDALAKLRQGSS